MFYVKVEYTSISVVVCKKPSNVYTRHSLKYRTLPPLTPLQCIRPHKTVVIGYTEITTTAALQHVREVVVMKMSDSFGSIE